MTSPTVEEALKACPIPWCGGKAIARTRLGGIAGAVELVGCTKCGLDTLPFATEAEAITAWNTRPLPIEAQGGEPEDDIRQALKDAFVAGAVAVAAHFGHPTDDFGEAGGDYADSVR